MIPEAWKEETEEMRWRVGVPTGFDLDVERSRCVDPLFDIGGGCGLSGDHHGCLHSRGRGLDRSLCGHSSAAIDVRRTGEPAVFNEFGT